LREVLLHCFIKKTAAESYHLLVEIYREHSSSENSFNALEVISIKINNMKMHYKIEK